MDQKLEALARETQKSLKEIQENTKANKEETLKFFFLSAKNT